MKLYLSTPLQPFNQRFRHYLKRLTLHRNVGMRLILGGTTLLVSVGAYYSYQGVRSLFLNHLIQSVFEKVDQGLAKLMIGWPA